MEFTDARTEILAFAERVQRTSGILAPLRGHRVTPPVQLDFGPLQREEYDDGGDGDGAAEGRRQHEVVLRPKPQVAFLEVDPRGVGDGHGGPDVRQVVGRPRQRAVEDGHRVHLPQPRLLEPLVRVVDDDGHDEADGESGQQPGVHAAPPEHFDGTYRAPEHRGCEEGVDSAAAPHSR